MTEVTNRNLASKRIAAIFVDKNGSYAGLENIDIWDESRDAMRYDGPYSVVAHPPCARWCKLSGLVEARYGYKQGDDGGLFEHALGIVRRLGGVLEHPAYSKAWDAQGLNKPPSGGGWVNADFMGGWTCYVEQGKYGHPSRKPTWLYAFGVDLPSLRWGHVPDRDVKALISRCWEGQDGDDRPRLGKKAASATPVEFRDVLIAMARSVKTGEKDECGRHKQAPWK